MQLCEKLAVENTDRLNGNVSVMHRAILHCVLSSSPPVRRKCIAILKRTAGSLSGNFIARALLKELENYLLSSKVPVSRVFLFVFNTIFVFVQYRSLQLYTISRTLCKNCIGPYGINFSSRIIPLIT